MKKGRLPLSIGGKKAIFMLSDGDMRKVVNMMQVRTLG